MNRAEGIGKTYLPRATGWTNLQLSAPQAPLKTQSLRLGKWQTSPFALS